VAFLDDLPERGLAGSPHVAAAAVPELLDPLPRHRRGTEEVDGVVGDVEVVASGAARLRAEAACSSGYEPLWYGM